jgi:hypothetical protein
VFETGCRGDELQEVAVVPVAGGGAQQHAVQHDGGVPVTDHGVKSDAAGCRQFTLAARQVRVPVWVDGEGL